METITLLQPRRSYEACNSDGAWPWRCDLNFIPIPAAVFGALFTILLVVHIGLAITRKRAVSWTAILACLLSAIGYFLKFGAGGPAPASVALLVLWQALIFIAPFFIHFYLYTLLRRLYDTYLHRGSVVNSAKGMFWGLMGTEIAILLLLLIGVGMHFGWGMYLSENLSMIGAVILFTAFLMQQMLYIIFIVFLALFYSAANRKRKVGGLEVQRDSLGGVGHTAAKYKPMVISLYVVVALLSIRAIYYLANTVTPADGFKSHPGYSNKKTNVDGSTYWDYVPGDWAYKFYEPGQYGFDAAAVFLALVVLALPWAHPGRAYADSDAVTAWRFGGRGDVELVNGAGTQNGDLESNAHRKSGEALRFDAGQNGGAHDSTIATTERKN